MWSPYRKRLLRDLDRWRSNGWLSEEGRTAILTDVESGARSFSLASALGILASVLFGFAAISFVAAHWDDVPRLVRLILLLASIWVGYGTAGWLEARGHSLLADAAVLFACGMFGASIMLVSQMYNIAGNPSDGVLLWWIGTLFAGAALRSNPARLPYASRRSAKTSSASASRLDLFPKMRPGQFFPPRAPSPST